jgi:hypothetical protein
MVQSQSNAVMASSLVKPHYSRDNNCLFLKKKKKKKTSSKSYPLRTEDRKLPIVGLNSGRMPRILNHDWRSDLLPGRVFGIPPA